MIVISVWIVLFEVVVFFFRDVFKTKPAEVIFALNTTHMIAPHALFDRGITFWAVLKSAMLVFRPLLVIHTFALVNSSTFETHDSRASGAHCGFCAATFWLGHDRITVSYWTPLKVASVVSDLHIFLLVFPHVHDPLIAEAFKVRDFKFLRTFLLQTGYFLL